MPDKTPAPWRDGPLVVIEALRPALPRRCVKSGAEDDVEFDLQELKFVSKIAGEDYLLKVDIPLSRGYQRQKLLVNALMGVTLVTLGTIAVVWVFGRDQLEQFGMQETVAVLGGAVAICLGLMVPIYNLARQPLLIRAMQGPHLWLLGANESFLQHLPPRPPHVPSFADRAYR